jgi:hypothetical protein
MDRSREPACALQNESLQQPMLVEPGILHVADLLAGMNNDNGQTNELLQFNYTQGRVLLVVITNTPHNVADNLRSVF